MLKDLKTQLQKLKTRQEALDAPDGYGEPDRLLQYFTKMARKTLGAERASIFIKDEDSDTVWLKAGTGLDQYEIEVSAKDSIAGRVIASGESVFETGLETREGTHRETDAQTGFETRNMLCVPIRDQQARAAIGAIQVLNKFDGDFTQEDELALYELAEHIKAHVQQAYLSQEMFSVTEKLADRADRLASYGLVAIALAVVIAVGASVV